MRIALIGAGNVATHLGKALKRKGYDMVCVYSRTAGAASSLALELGCRYTTSFSDIDNGADIYISSIKDSAFQEQVGNIVKGRKDALFIHTAGSLSIDVWKGYAKRYGVLYPMQTFSKMKSLDFSQIPLFVEADSDDSLSLIRSVASDLSTKVYDADSNKRRFLHISAVFACNFSNHMYALCSELLENNGISFDVMLPLIDETAAKVHHLSPKEAQTGPAIRYDENVIKAHLAMLDGDKDMQRLYEMISRSINKMGKR